MKAILPFDKAVAGGVSIDLASLVPGSASVSIGGDDKTQTAFDGSPIMTRTAQTVDAAFTALGDFSALNSPRGFAVEASLLLAGAELVSFVALVSASYDAESRSTAISLRGLPL